MSVAPLDLAACVGLVVIGVVAIAALLVAHAAGVTVAAAAVGGIAGWLARAGAQKIADQIDAPGATVTTDVGK